MTDLTPEELADLPYKLRMRHWAGSIGEGYEGLSAVTLKQAIRDCREWLDGVKALAPGDRVSLNSGETRVEVVAVYPDGFDPGDGTPRWPGCYVTILDLGARFLVSVQRIERCFPRGKDGGNGEDRGAALAAEPSSLRADQGGRV